MKIRAIVENRAAKNAFSSRAVDYISVIANADILDTKAGRLTGQSFSSLLRSQRVSIGRQDQLRLVQTITTLMHQLKNCQHHLLAGQQVVLA